MHQVHELGDQVSYPELTQSDVDCLNKNKCADCEQPLFEGPQGGGSMNFICGNEKCGSKFNYALSWERISEIAPMHEDGDSTPVEVPYRKGPYR